MKAKYRPVNRLARPIVCICLLFVLLAWPRKSVAHDEWFRDLDLEPVLSEASLVLAGRVADVSSTVITAGGKGEFTVLQFKFLPVLLLVSLLAACGGTTSSGTTSPTAASGDAAAAPTTASAAAAPVANGGPNTIVLGAYSTPREAYGKLIPIFKAQWKQQTGQEIRHPPQLAAMRLKGKIRGRTQLCRYWLEFRPTRSPSPLPSP